MKLKGGLVKRVRPLFKTGVGRHEKRLHDCEALGVSALASLVPLRTSLVPLRTSLVPLRAGIVPLRANLLPLRASIFPLWASLVPLRMSDPAGIQTLDLQNRNLTLYSAKLRGRW